MSRLNALDPDNTSGKTKELFNAISSKFGGVSNMMRTMGNAPALLEGYLNFYSALSSGSLGAKTSALIALTVSENNGCNYCLAAHQFLGATFNKLNAETMVDARRGESKDPKTDAILKFALTLTNKKGGVSDADIATVKKAGVTENEIGEIIGQVGLNILSNYFNKAADTELDSFLRS